MRAAGKGQEQCTAAPPPHLSQPAEPGIRPSLPVPIFRTVLHPMSRRQWRSSRPGNTRETIASSSTCTSMEEQASWSHTVYKPKYSENQATMRSGGGGRRCPKPFTRAVRHCFAPAASRHRSIRAPKQAQIASPPPPCHRTRQAADMPHLPEALGSRSPRRSG